ncbi:MULTISPECIES: DUF4010 domain-containing protein [unclassified Paludibacterium]|uniref:MgtC/SapB family protein n=1 Tax=unclassified Paludibacterium TaxID=2618429 RepID=UPI001C05DD56|nr:DUF4010 domain-containing protein [Paludibacterium sp. B53371]BEV70727.1 MgtC/SapB family protein [Paludibacterium sp. THUN1379]
MNGFHPADWLQLTGTPLEALPALLTSLGIGLLVGIERERKRHVLAGIRTFPLGAMFGTLCAMIGQHSGEPLFPLAGLLVLTAFGFLPGVHGVDENSDPHTTTIAAFVVVYCLGVLVYYGYAPLAVAGAILVTALLYLKPELVGLTRKLDRRDIYSLLQFGALSFIILPLLPNRAIGPFEAFNPHQVWLMVVLIVGLGQVGYLSVRLFGNRVGAPLLGLLGGLVSSTVTSLIYARQVKREPASLVRASTIIQLANLVLNLRMMLFAAALAPAALPFVATVMAPGMLLGLAIALLRHHRQQRQEDQQQLALSNPADLKMALGFAAAFALILLVSAWLNAEFGRSGVYTVAVISGANEVDAIVLTVLNLFAQQRFEAVSCATAIALAVGANALFKMGLIFSMGGRELALRCLPTFLAILGGLMLGTLALQLGWL